tara:strand:- start:18 stop:389 length:372 start_codon:yes stop_codon:yes gene_type:complete
MIGTQSKIIAILIILMTVGGYLYYTEIESHAETRAELKIQEKAKETLVKSIKDSERERRAVESEVERLNLESTQQRRELSSLRDREDVVLAKPGLVEIKINKSFKKSQELLACLTGDTKLCEN